MTATLISALAMLIAGMTLSKVKNMERMHEGWFGRYAEMERNIRNLTERINIPEKSQCQKAELDLDWYRLAMARNAVFGDMKYACVGKSVMLSGDIVTGQSTDYECVFVLPCGFQPEAIEERSVNGDAGGRDVAGVLKIYKDGHVYLRSPEPYTHFKIKIFFER